MIKELYKGKLTFITPCFCSGANQNIPEIRSTAIKGQLHWWFRVLGVTPILEKLVFGGLSNSDKDKPSASKIIVRIEEKRILPGATMELKPNSIEQYLYHFAEVSGQKEGIHRTMSTHYIAEGSSFTLSILQIGEIGNPTAEEILHNAIELFLCLGSIGLRSTRGCGCFTAEGKSIKKLDVALFSKELLIRSLSNDSYPNGKVAQIRLGSWLKEDVRKNLKLSGKDKTVVGFSIKNEQGESERESSALKLRPVEVDGKFLPYIYYSDAACSQKSILDRIKNTF